MWCAAGWRCAGGVLLARVVGAYLFFAGVAVLCCARCAVLAVLCSLCCARCGVRWRCRVWVIPLFPLCLYLSVSLGGGVLCCGGVVWSYLFFSIPLLPRCSLPASVLASFSLGAVLCAVLCACLFSFYVSFCGSTLGSSGSLAVLYLSASLCASLAPLLSISMTIKNVI